MSVSLFTDGIVTHPDGYRQLAHVIYVASEGGQRFARTSFGTFTKRDDGVWRWLAGDGFTLTFEE